MESIIRFALSNFTLTFVILGLVASAVALVRAPKPFTAPVVIEALLSYFILFSVGFSFFYNFVMHTFFGEMSAAFIGWEDSPFQAEVGYASLGFALIGFLGFRRGFDMRLAAVTGIAAFLWGAAAGHIQEIVHQGNFAPGNAGVILYTDILLPLAGFILLWLQRRHRGDSRPPLR
ncbi:MAG: hypothetical protein M9932_10135 [Xanthobacteraceae bacterium]|nr:hypothetical protein [Xanthobacteraceae bacterium]